jgi:putative hydrolase of the HAD superfamily
MFDVIAFDADDTLWENESLYAHTQEKFARLLRPYLDGEDVGQQLYATETRNIPYFGYGIKSFTLSMIETAIALTQGRIQVADIQSIVDLAKAMLDAPVHLLDGVEDVVARLAASHTLMLVTKGDLLDQQRKLERSSLAGYFTHIEVVSEKTEETYRTLLAHYKVEAGRFLMVGNSLKSDVLPVIAIGGRAVYIPYHITWEHERVDKQATLPTYYELEHVGMLPNLLEKLEL